MLLMSAGCLLRSGPGARTPNPALPSMTAPEDTHSTHDNAGGVPTEAELIEYLQDVDQPVSLDRLAKATGATRDQLKSRVQELDERGLIIVSIGLYHVTTQMAEGVHPVADGGPRVDDVDVEVAAELTPAEIYTVLSNERRREVIRTVARKARRDGVGETYAPVSPLAEAVTSSESDFAPASDAPADEQHATYVSLVQTHLPLLDDFGVVEYYSRVQKVGATDTLLALDVVMNTVDDVAVEVP